MKTITVKVTKKDIAQGDKCSPRTCPLALAAQRAFHDPSAYVLSASVQSSHGFGPRMLPPVAMRFMKLFDKHGHHRKYKPFSFRLKIP